MNKRLGEVSYITKLAGFEHTNYIQGNCTHEPQSDSDIPLFIGKTVRNGQIDTDFDWYIPKTISEKLERSKLYKKCLVLPYVGTLGDLAIFNGLYAAHLGSNIAKIELNSNSGYTEEFIYYFLKSPYGQTLLLRDVQGAIQKNITMEAIRNVELPDISIDLQNTIVKHLMAIDSKIANNNAINAELEAMSKTIYDYWFLQFEFPDENGKPYKSSGGKMVWNEELKREIPEGWKVRPLLDMCAWEGTSQPPKSVFVYAPQEGYVRFIQNRDYEDSAHATYIPISEAKGLCDERDILIDKYGDAGKTRFGLAGAYNVALSKISVHKQIHREYIRAFLSSAPVYTYLHESSMASTRASLNENNISYLSIVLPPEEILAKFNLLVEEILEKILHIQKENQELASLRDFLLPLLMNGQVGFKD